MKDVKKIFFGNGECCDATKRGRLIEVDGEHFGDGICWVLEIDKGNVTAKHNARYLESIIYWEQVEEKE